MTNTEKTTERLSIPELVAELAAVAVALSVAAVSVIPFNIY